MGSFKDITPEGAKALYASYSGDALKLTFWHGLFMAGCGIIMSRSLNDGLEKLTSIAMPVFFALLISLIIMAAVIGDFAAGVKFLFQPDFSKVSFEMAISALGQAFFSIGVALGIMLTFGAYLPDNTSIIKSALIVCVADTLVAILAGLTIFPIVFGFGMEPNVGSALVFNTMTVAFGQLEYGGIIGLGFFLLLAIAGFTTMIALMEQMVSYLNKFYDIKRSIGAPMVAGSIFIVGLLPAFSTNILASVTVSGMNLLDLFDWWINQFGLLLGGLFMSIFVGWILKKETVIGAFGKNEKYVNLIYFLIRYFCPVAIIIVFVSQFT